MFDFLHIPRLIVFCAVTIMVAALPGELSAAPEACGYSPIHQLKYTSEDSHFEYVNPNAPNGGKINIGRVGSFNSLNFLRYPGSTIADRGQIPLNVTEYLFDSFLVKSADEVAGFYCLAASAVKISKDLSKVSFTLNPDVRFHDGKSLSVDDVIFTFETLKRQGPPYYRQVLRDISIKSEGQAGVVYINKRKGDRDFPSLVGRLPLHPKHFWDNGRLTEKAMILPLGSGPYQIAKAISGKLALLKRAKNYWARNHFTQKGRYNFDEIKIDYFRDNRSALEAFKTGNYDIRVEQSALTWKNEYQGNAFKDGKIKKLAVQTQKPGDMYLLAFNERRQIFKNRDVRKALALLYDFDAANRILFHKLYKPIKSLYGNTELAAKGPASLDEKTLITPFIQNLPEGVLSNDGPLWLQNSAQSRARIREATKLLDAAGILMKNGKRIDPLTGEPMVLEVAYLNRRHQRILLQFSEKLKAVGIQLSLPEREMFAARKKVLDHEFDMVVIKWNPEILAGTSEALLWGGKFADIKGSYALAGIKDPALDFAINKLQHAADWKTMLTAARVFDRIFRWQVHAILLWSTDETWVSYWDKYSRPRSQALYEVTLIDQWWAKKQKQSQIIMK